VSQKEKNQEKFKTLVEEFYKVSDEYREFGATDTEPRCNFSIAVGKVLTTGVGKTPRGAESWELFTFSMNCGKAGRALTKACAKVVAFVKRLSENSRLELADWAEDYYGFY